MRYVLYATGSRGGTMELTQEREIAVANALFVNQGDGTFALASADAGVGAASGPPP